MNYIRKIANSDVLAGIMNIPENMRHRKVEIIVLPYEEETRENSNIKVKKSSKGVLNKYANVNYLPLEESAWAESVGESHKEYD